MKKVDKKKTEKTIKATLYERKVHSFSSLEAKQLADLVKKKLIEMIEAGNSPLIIHVLTNFFENPREIIEGKKKAAAIELLEGLSKQILRLNLHGTVDDTTASSADDSEAGQKHLPSRGRGRKRKNNARKSGLRNVGQKKG